MVEVGQPPGGLHSRGVECLIGSGARSELHWIPGDAYSSGKAEALLRELASYGLQSTLAERLHGTICQSLTAAHLHLELGLMTTPDAPEEFALARQLVHDATVSVRELMDELAGETT